MEYVDPSKPVGINVLFPMTGYPKAVGSRRFQPLSAVRFQPKMLAKPLIAAQGSQARALVSYALAAIRNSKIPQWLGIAPASTS